MCKLILGPYEDHLSKSSVARVTCQPSFTKLQENHQNIQGDFQKIHSLIHAVIWVLCCHVLALSRSDIQKKNDRGSSETSSRKNILSIQVFVRYAAHQRALNAALYALQFMALRGSDSPGAVVEKSVTLRHFNCRRGTQGGATMQKVGTIKMAASHSHILFLTISVSLSQNYFSAPENNVVTNGP